MVTVNSNEVEYDYPVGYEPEVRTKAVELDRRTVERFGVLRENDESYGKLVTELASILAAGELSAARVSNPLIE